MKYAEDLRGKCFVLVGSVVDWPSYLPWNPTETLISRGASVLEEVSAAADYAVVFAGRLRGRAEALRRAEALAAEGKLTLLDHRELIHLLRPDLKGATFAFVGGFASAVDGVLASSPEHLAQVGGGLSVPLGPDVDFVVVGPRRKKGRTAAMRELHRLERGGARFRVLDEEGFLDMMSAQATAPKASGVGELLLRLRAITDAGRLQRALKMLKADRYQLFMDVTDEHLVGIVKSQTGASSFYSTRLHASGDYGCCRHDLETCMGLQGRICKHLLVLALGAVQAGEIDVATLDSWLAKAAQKRPSDERQEASDTILRYRSAEAGELDWRPTETTPEDFYAY